MKLISGIEGDSEFFRLLTNNSFDIISLLSEEGDIIFENNAAKKILGFGIGELNKESAFDSIHPDDKSLVVSKFSNLLENPGSELILEFRFRSADGKWVWLESKARNHLSNEKIKGIIVNTRDISVIKQKFLEAEQLNRRLESAFLADIIAWWEMELPSGKIWYHPDKARMIGHNPENFTHYKHFMDLIHPDDYDSVIQGVKDHISGKKRRYECRYRIRHADGNYIWFHDIGKITYKDGKNMLLSGIVTDISDNKNVEQELYLSEEKYRKLNATKDKFFRIMSHDLRSPVATIINFSELALKKLRKKEYEKLEKYLKIIIDTSKKNLDLLVNLLDWSRLQTDQIDFKPKSLNLCDILREMTNFMNAFAFNKNIHLKLDVPKEIEIYADRNMIDTILRNLFTNAIKYTKGNGCIKLSAKRQDEKTLVQVQDSGVGIPKEDLDKLFHIDQSFSKPGTNKEPGTGLGLILCQEFINKHGGKIWAESEVGKGTTFSFII